jgi:type IV secretion system protein VirB10
MTDAIHPVEGEQLIPEVVPPATPAVRPSRIIVGLLIATVLLALLVFVFLTIRRHLVHRDDPQAKSTASVVAAGHELTMPASSPAQVPSPTPPTGSASGPIVPSIGAADTQGTPIAVRATGAKGPPNLDSGQNARPHADPDDAPIFPGDSAPALHRQPGASTGQGGDALPAGLPPRTGDPVADARASLSAYRTQLAGMMDSLQKRVAMATGGQTGGTTSMSAVAPGGSSAGLTTLHPASVSGDSGNGGGSPAHSSTARVSAQMLGDLNMILPMGTMILCGLKTRVITATSGMVSCQTERDIRSANGNVVLLEKGSHLDGEFHVVQIHPGLTRIPVIWTRIRTPAGVTADLESPATGSLGESGLDAYVDNRWGERLGAALMLSLIDDVITYETQKQATQAGNTTQVILPNTTAEGQKMAEQVLNATINIPPLMYQNQGNVAGVYVARDIDFSTVYALRAQ